MHFEVEEVSPVRALLACLQAAVVFVVAAVAVADDLADGIGQSKNSFLKQRPRELFGVEGLQVVRLLAEFAR